MNLVIWTVREGGGLALGRALARGAGAEPVRVPADLPALPAALLDAVRRNDVALAAATVQPLLQTTRPWVVFLDELPPRETDMLLAALASLDCRHVVAMRRTEADATLLAALRQALGLADGAGWPGPAAIAAAAPMPGAAGLRSQARVRIEAAARLRWWMAQRGVPAALVDVGDEAALQDLLAGLVEAPDERDRVAGDVGAAQAVDAAALDAAAPRRAALHRELAWSRPVDADWRFLEVTTTALEAVDVVERLMLPPGARSIAAGTAVRFAGACLPRFGLRGPFRLGVLVGPRFVPVHWGEPSPAMAALHPDLPAARNARFVSEPFAADPARPATLVMVEPGGRSVPIARMSFSGRTERPVPGIALHRWGIGYAPIPKVACTSIKESLHELMHGQRFQPGASGPRHIHDFFYHQSEDIAAMAWRFVVVRDPVKRLLSAFSNRVEHHRELSASYLQRLKAADALDLDAFPFDPGLEGFIDRLEFYQRVPTIGHHTQPVSNFIPTLDAFDRVYRIEELDRLQADLSQRVGQPFKLGREQTGGRKIRLKSLSRRHLDRLLAFYRDDYALLAPHYSIDEIVAEWNADRAA